MPIATPTFAVCVAKICAPLAIVVSLCDFRSFSYTFEILSVHYMRFLLRSETTNNKHRTSTQIILRHSFVASNKG